MFGDDDEASQALVSHLLEMFTFSDLLEMNDLTEEEVLTYLISGGHIGEPERVFEEFYSKSIED